MFASIFIILHLLTLNFRLLFYSLHIQSLFIRLNVEKISSEPGSTFIGSREKEASYTLMYISQTDQGNPACFSPLSTK